MGNRIVIVGAGGFGRGVYSWLTSSPRHLASHQIDDVVFVDDFATSAPAPIVATVDSFVPEASDDVICALGVPTMRMNVTERLRARDARFHTFVDDRCVLADGVRIGEGAVLCPGVVVSADATIGSHVHINFSCSIGHDTVIGSFTTLSPSVNIMGEVSVGESVFFGGSAVVLPRTVVGDRVTVGAGAIVLRSVEAGLTVVGNPAARIVASEEAP